MAPIEANNGLSIELLSLRHEQSAYQLEVGVTRKAGYITTFLNIDEFTYNQLNLLGPFTEGRARLSLYPKRDPYRNIYYSTLVKINKSFNETLYFGCTEVYVSQLLELKQREKETSTELPGVQAALPAGTVPRQPRPRRKPWKPGRIVLRMGLFIGLMLVLVLRLEGNSFGDSMDTREIPAAATTGLPVDQAPAIANPAWTASYEVQQLPLEHPEDPPEKEQIQAYSEIVVNPDTYEFGLPEGYVALTFDDGPSRYTKDIVDILAEQDIVATFLFVGQNVLQHPQEAKYTAEHDMAIGSHSWDHSQMTANTGEENTINLSKANQALENITGYPITIFRPPYGSIDNQLAGKVQEMEMKVLMWNRDPKDWSAKTPDQIVHYFQTTDPSGGIYLLHEKKLTVEALPEIITYLKSKNLKFVVFK